MLQPTEEFLLELHRSNSEDCFEIILGRFEKKSHEINWSRILDSGFKVFLPIYLEIKAHPRDFKIPEEIEHRIRLQYISNVGRNERIKQAVIELAKVFNKAKINLIFLKGAALLPTLYKDDVGVRLMGDIDTLMEKDDLPKAEDIVRSIGYGEDYGILTKRLKWQITREMAQKYYHFIYFRNQFQLELHWDFSLKTDPILLRKIFESSKRVTIDETEISILSSEAHIFIAFINFIKDFLIIFPLYCLEPKDKEKMFYYSLFFLYEIKKVSQYYKNKISWNELLLFCRAHKIEHDVLILLFLAQKIVNAHLPESIVKKIKQDVFANMYICLCQNIKYDDFTRLFLARNIILRITRYGMLSKNLKKSVKNIYSVIMYCLYLYDYKWFFMAKKIVKGLKLLRRLIFGLYHAIIFSWKGVDRELSE